MTSCRQVWGRMIFGMTILCFDAFRHPMVFATPSHISHNKNIKNNIAHCGNQMEGLDDTERSNGAPMMLPPTVAKLMHNGSFVTDIDGAVVGPSTNRYFPPRPSCCTPKPKTTKPYSPPPPDMASNQPWLFCGRGTNAMDRGLWHVHTAAVHVCMHVCGLRMVHWVAMAQACAAWDVGGQAHRY